jgi:hypothetical protein
MSVEAPTPASMSVTSLMRLKALKEGRLIRSEITSPLFQLLTQINKAAEGGLDLLAVSMAVALPDICAALISDDGRTNRALYKAWCAANLKADFAHLTPDDLYSMRCGVLHNGRLGDGKSTIKRVVLLPPGGSTFTDCTADDGTYVYSTIEFCRNFNRAVVAWYEANQRHPNVQKHVLQLMQYRSSYYVQGRTVIA